MLANAVAHETGALLLNLSAANVAGKFAGKNGPMKLIHMVFAIAKDPAKAGEIISHSMAIANNFVNYNVLFFQSARYKF